MTSLYHFTRWRNKMTDGWLRVFPKPDWWIDDSRLRFINVIRLRVVVNPTWLILPYDVLYESAVPSHVQGLEMITFIIYNPIPQTSVRLISDYLENPVLEVLSKFSTSQNTANIYGSGAGSY